MNPHPMTLTALAGALALLVAPNASGQGADPREEIKDLFRKIEKDLSEIDKLLLNASTRPQATPSEGAAAKGARGEAVSPAGTGDAKEAHGKQKEVVDSIQKILDLIPRTGGGGGGGGT